VSREGGPDGVGVASRLDLPSGAVSASVPTGRAPHTQGDLTGAMRGDAFVESGSETHVFDGCEVDGPTEWRDLHIEGDAGAAGQILVEARHAIDRSSLPSASFVTVGVMPDMPSPFALSFPLGGVVEVRVTLSTASRGGAPRLRRVGLEWRCSGPD
jgi:hypothetical protein